jgi:hypothetical protein
MRVALLWALLALAHTGYAYYVPGTYPMEFYAGDVLQGGSGGAGARHPAAPTGAPCPKAVQNNACEVKHWRRRGMAFGGGLPRSNVLLPGLRSASQLPDVLRYGYAIRVLHDGGQREGGRLASDRGGARARSAPTCLLRRAARDNTACCSMQPDASVALDALRRMQLVTRATIAHGRRRAAARRAALCSLRLPCRRQSFPTPRPV